MLVPGAALLLADPAAGGQRILRGAVIRATVPAGIMARSLYPRLSDLLLPYPPPAPLL